MTKLSAEVDQLMRCCIFGSSNMLWPGQSISIYGDHVGILVEFVNERGLDNFRLMDSGGGGSWGSRRRRYGGGRWHRVVGSSTQILFGG